MQPLPDHTGWQITPTLRSGWTATTDPANNPLRAPFTVCVLGASRGIGASIASAYAAAGASGILLTGRDESALEAAAKATKAAGRTGSAVDVRTAVCDVTIESDIEAAATLVRSAWGRLDVLVVNAALWGQTAIRVTEGSTQQFRTVVDIDVVGAYLAAHHFVPLLLTSENGARAYVAISGTGAWVVDGPVAHAAHCVSKLAQARLIEHMANDFRAEKLLVLAVHPGCVWTDTSKLAPEIFHPLLADEPGLCGGFLVWLTRKSEDKLWMSGRFLSATWDADELASMKDAIVEKDLLKARMAIS